MEMSEIAVRGPAVRAEGLVKHYNGRDAGVEAVRGVDLEVHTGEIFGFLGPSPVARRWAGSTWPATRTKRASGSASRSRRPASIPARQAASCW